MKPRSAGHLHVRELMGLMYFGAMAAYCICVVLPSFVLALSAIFSPKPSLKVILGGIPFSIVPFLGYYGLGQLATANSREWKGFNLVTGGLGIIPISVSVIALFVLFLQTDKHRSSLLLRAISVGFSFAAIGWFWYVLSHL